MRILVGLKVRQYFNKNKEAIRIIEVSEKLEIAAAGQKNLLANGDIDIKGNAYSFEKEMNYFDVESKSKNILSQDVCPGSDHRAGRAIE